MGTLEDKVAIVTGAGRGIGRAIALKLASEGARVIVNDIDLPELEAVVGVIEETGGTVSIVAGDVTEASFGDHLMEQTLKRYGTLDILINNAGYIWNSAIHNHTLEQWNAMLEIHVTAPFLILKAAANFFREVGKKEQEYGLSVCRKVINVSSVSGIYGAATQIGYSAGKAAIIGLTKTLAQEWGRYNVTVNCVAFGHIDTRLTQEYGDSGPPSVEVKGRELKVGLHRDTLEQIHAHTPLGRGGTPQEAAGAIYLFCIPESNYVSGQVLVCSGGR